MMTCSTTPTITPSSVTVARIAALAQAATGTALAVGAGALTAAAYASDRSAAAAGEPNEWAGLGEYIGVLACIVAAVATLTSAIPAVRLRRDRPMARQALLMAEGVLMVPIGLWLASDLKSFDFGGWTLLGGAFEIVAGVTVAALTRPSARNWSADSVASPLR